MPVPPVLSLVTLGVADVAASTRFYEALGFPLSSASVPGEVSFFRMTGGLLGVYGLDALAADAQLERGTYTGFRGATFAVNLASREAVDDAVAAAEQAGARILKPAQPTEWGGYHAYFADPDGHAWEVAHNPFWPLDDTGLPRLSE
jgi:catechol 2,3-dioxygenase-like lactoylglutathione lyase family enzyme